MTIRKGRLHKICIKCGGSYEPEGKFQRLCRKCKPKTYINGFLHLQKEVDRKMKKKTATPKHRAPYKPRNTPTIKKKRKVRNNA